MKHFMFLLLFHFTSSTIYFKIKFKRGIHIWNIPENEDADPDYMRFNLLITLNTSISDSPRFNSKSPDSSSKKPNTMTLETGNTYIILKINEWDDIFLYYWIGAQSSEKKRKNVAYSAGFILKNQILTEEHDKNLKMFHREAEGMENGFFCTLFKLPVPRRKPRLYRIAGSTGQFIMEVPRKYSELNGSDSFLLHKYREALNWNSIHSNKYKISQAKTFGEHIQKRNKEMQGYEFSFYSVTEGDPNINKNQFKEVEKVFLKYLTGVPTSRKFPNKPLNYTDEELANERREKLELYEYSRTYVTHLIDKRLVPWRVLRFDILKENNAYVLVDRPCGNINVFLGKDAGSDQFRESLSDAEKYSKTIGVEDAWQKVKVFRQGQELPIQLKMYFECDT